MTATRLLGRSPAPGRHANSAVSSGVCALRTRREAADSSSLAALEAPGSWNRDVRRADRPSVIVPVLSEQMHVIRPMFSTDDRAANERLAFARGGSTPTPRKNVKTTGNSSGSAATASVTALEQRIDEAVTLMKSHERVATKTYQIAARERASRPVARCAAWKRRAPRLRRPTRSARSRRRASRRRCGDAQRGASGQSRVPAAPVHLARGSRLARRRARLRTGSASPVSADSSTCMFVPRDDHAIRRERLTARTDGSPGTRSRAGRSAWPRPRARPWCRASRLASPCRASVRRCSQASMPSGTIETNSTGLGGLAKNAYRPLRAEESDRIWRAVSRAAGPRVRSAASRRCRLVL